MKILVIDDTQMHLDSALETLKGHEVVTCSSHDEACELLDPNYERNKRQQKVTDYVWKEHITWEAAYKMFPEPEQSPYWDAVLCDLMMPAGSYAQGEKGRKYVGQEMPVGWSLALTAVTNGAKYVAVVTDLNHHHHPASAMLDSLNHHIFKIDGAKMLLTNRVSCDPGKDWEQVLEKLMA